MSSLIDTIKGKKKQPEKKTVADTATAPKKTASPKSKSTQTVVAPVLVRPLVSEKGAAQQAQHKYFFEVARSANKIQIKHAIEVQYDVRVVAVNVLNQRGKRVQFGRRQGMRKAWKKAIITLAPGDRITTVEGV